MPSTASKPSSKEYRDFEENVVRHPSGWEIPVVHPANDLRSDVVVPVVDVRHPDENASTDDCDRHQLRSENAESFSYPATSWVSDPPPPIETGSKSSKAP
jgi:hypothetical protein